ncbi:hypothetical protein [Desulfopila inferna]|uniref:hypothetical protein n=1 Tax=Desulfopila inferna TaxID=468528 RepID=UPI001964D92F|nr:hypothetical protein [Desulfopila inferna]MBM9606093.1 hypothetical protein [Desulfopila inferna]
MGGDPLAAFYRRCGPYTLTSIEEIGMTKRRTTKLKLRNHKQLFISGLFIFVLYAGYANAYDNGTVELTWQENPPEEYVVGYRLYYGSDSRFDDNGNLKSNFAYNYFIDVFESVRCSNYDNTCEYLAPDELTCITDNVNDPLCTVGNFEGTAYLAMTAYDDNEESDYTHELTIVPSEPVTEEPPPVTEEPPPATEEPPPATEEPPPATEEPTEEKTDNPNKPDKSTDPNGSTKVDNPNKPVKNK